MNYAHGEDRTLHADETPLLADMATVISTTTDPLGNGVFLTAEAPEPADYHEFVLGRIAGLDRFTCCHRTDPFWMIPAAGQRLEELPEETQFLMARLDNGKVAIFLPLIDGWWRCSLAPSRAGELLLVAQTGDTDTVGKELTGIFIAVGDDPYTLMPAAAASVAAHMKTGRLRRDKPLPPVADLFGWCTWDAFYQDVSHDKVLDGLKSFADGGVSPRAIILDDGWHCVAMANGTRRLAGFSANERFPGDLANTVQTAKRLYGIQLFYVWHAMVGYWGGVDGNALPQYQVVEAKRDFAPALKRKWHGQNDAWWGQTIGMVHPDSVGHFFNDFHRHLREQGVDGVKVDSQCELEGLGANLGGRVELMRSYHEALEGSAQIHFLGNLINCMSCSNDMIFSTLNSNLTRTSTDFWPKRPESHSLHLYTNAQTSFWMGEFIHPDWDMFQSDHPMGAYHGAARAVSGGPVYVSDSPTGHDLQLLRKLVLSDGTTLRALHPGRPSPDCIFHDPRTEDIPLKIFNLNTYGGLLGIFNARWIPDAVEQPFVRGTLTIADVPGLPPVPHAIYAHCAGTLDIIQPGDSIPFTLPPNGYEIHTLMPIGKGFAPLGLVDKFNSGGAITRQRVHGNVHLVDLRDGGHFVAHCADRPLHVLVDGIETTFTHDATTNRLDVQLHTHGPLCLEIVR